MNKDRKVNKNFVHDELEFMEEGKEIRECLWT